MRKTTTRREVMTLGLGAVALGAGGEAAAADEARGARKVGHHFHNGVPAEIHVAGSGFKPTAATSVTLTGTFGSTTVSWNPSSATVLSVTADRIKVSSTPSWTVKEGDPDHGRGIGSLTVTVTNDGMMTTTMPPETDVSYE
jgi:hypothetical protein